MTASWREIEQRLNIEQAEGFVRHNVEPHLRDIVVEEVLSRDDTPKRMQLPLAAAFGMFLIGILISAAILPDNFIGEALQFILFPILFLASIAVSLYLFQDRFMSLFLEGKERFVAQSKAMSEIAKLLELQYVPSPGGAPKLLKIIAKSRLAPRALQDITETLDAHGGMDAPLEAARRSGALVSDAVVLGSEEQKKKYFEQQAYYQQVEDGFHGTRGSMTFNAFEWIETVEDAPNIYHLALVLEAPTRLYGLTQLRSRGAAWPSSPTDKPLNEVQFTAKEFEDRFRLRSTDQVEARVIFNPAVLERVSTLAHGEKIRAVGFESNLVFDIAGENRFHMVDLKTGLWSEETIKATFINIAELLELVDEVGHAFMLRSEEGVVVSL